MHECCKQTYTYFVTFNSKLPLIHYISCNFTFILVKHVHTLVKLCVVKQKVRLFTILDFFSILVSDFFPAMTFSQSKELSMAPLLSLRIKFYWLSLSRYVITAITLFISLFCPWFCCCCDRWWSSLTTQFQESFCWCGWCPILVMAPEIWEGFWGFDVYSSAWCHEILVMAPEIWEGFSGNFS